MLSHDYWRTRFGESRDVLNQPLVVNGQPLTIVGVAPRGFQGTTLGANPHVFVPMTHARLDGVDVRQEPREPPRLLGVRVRAPEAGRPRRAGRGVDQRALSRPIINDVEAPLQKGMSEQTMKQFRARKIDR